MNPDTISLKTFAKMLLVNPYVVRRWIREGKIEPKGVDGGGEPEFSLEYATRVADRAKEARGKGHKWGFLRYAIGQGPIPLGPTPEYMSPQTFARLTAWKRRNVMKGHPPIPKPHWDPEIAAANLRAQLDKEEAAKKARAPKGPDWSEVAKAFRAERKKTPRT